MFTASCRAFDRDRVRGLNNNKLLTANNSLGRPITYLRVDLHQIAAVFQSVNFILKSSDVLTNGRCQLKVSLTGVNEMFQLQVPMTGVNDRCQ